jgi:hypothetical protein
MGRFPGETSCLTLVWAVLDLIITHQTNGIRFNQLDRQRLDRMRYQGNDETLPRRRQPDRLTTAGNLDRGEVTAAQARDPSAPSSLCGRVSQG